MRRSRAGATRLGRTLVASAALALHWACSAAGPTPEVPSKPAPEGAPSPGSPTGAESSSTEGKASEREPVSLEAAQAHLEAARYAKAERHFRALLQGPRASAEARLGVAEVLLATGRLEQARSWLEPLRASDDVLLARPAARLSAQVAERLGRREGALALLRPLVGARGTSPALERGDRLQVAELLLATGRRTQAEPLLMTIIEDYNEDRVTADDALGLAQVGRAAHLLRSPHDANDAFNASEQAGPPSAQVALWRAELFAERHNPGEAEGLLVEVLKRAPEHPQLLGALARVRLEMALDFDSARELSERALAVDPGAVDAHLVLAGIHIRNADLMAARKQLAKALERRPDNLQLLSVRAAVAFLSEKLTEFARLESQVLAINPEYSRFYILVGQFAEWEHRYARLVDLMRKAIAIDPNDAYAHAALGMNLIRGGQELAGLHSLRKAHAEDPFNVRVFNTLQLYEQDIVDHYVTQRQGPFRFRYPRQEQALLSRYVPDLLSAALARFKQYYEFEPSEPLGIELYFQRPHFAVRTSGLPQTAIQGVCFGETLASLTPREEQFNLGMTLWHELAHVFHIQMSESHVPRWLTEGLAEYETLVERPEWTRYHDEELYIARRAGRLPPVEHFNQAFTEARGMADMAIAYYAASQIAVVLVESFGRPAVARLIRAYSQGLSTKEALEVGLGKGGAQRLQAAFDEYLDQRLSRYSAQFVPIASPQFPREALQAAHKSKRDFSAQLKGAKAALDLGDLALARKILKRAQKLDDSSVDFTFLSAQALAQQDQISEALQLLEALLQAGGEGYALRMAMGELYLRAERPDDAKAAWTHAHRLDPTQGQPLLHLAEQAEADGQVEEEIVWLQQLVPLSAHQPRVYRRLLKLLLQEKRFAEAVQVGESAVYVDMEGAETHSLFALALENTGERERARFEHESAILCPGAAAEHAEAQRRYAEFLERIGLGGLARKHRKLAQQADPASASEP